MCLLNETTWKTRHIKKNSCLLQLEHQENDSSEKHTEKRHWRTSDCSSRLIRSRLHVEIRETVIGCATLDGVKEENVVVLPGVGVALCWANSSVVQHQMVAWARWDCEGIFFKIGGQICIDGVVISVLRSYHCSIPGVSVEIGLIENIQINVLARVNVVVNCSCFCVSAERSPVIITPGEDVVRTPPSVAGHTDGKGGARFTTSCAERQHTTSPTLFTTTTTSAADCVRNRVPWTDYTVLGTGYIVVVFTGLWSTRNNTIIAMIGSAL